MNVIVKLLASPKEKSAKGYRLIEMRQLKRAIYQQQNYMQHLNFRRISTGEVLPEVRRSRTHISEIFPMDGCGTCSNQLFHFAISSDPEHLKTSSKDQNGALILPIIMLHRNSVVVAHKIITRMKLMYDC